MDRGLKQRLIGATVIIALGVIVIPMLVDDPDKKIEVDIQAIPEPPVIEEVAVDAYDEATDELQIIDIPIERIDETVVEEQGSNAELEIVNEQSDAPVIGEDKQINQSKPLPSAVTEQNKQAEVKQAVAKPKPVQKPTVDEQGLPVAWSVQAGSYTESKNANALQTKLRKAGYMAFTQVVSKGSSTVTRVLVGPEIQRSKAEALLKQLKVKFNLDGFIVRYKP